MRKSGTQEKAAGNPQISQIFSEWNLREAVDFCQIWAIFLSKGDHYGGSI